MNYLNHSKSATLHNVEYSDRVKKKLHQEIFKDTLYTMELNRDPSQVSFFNEYLFEFKTK
ncbi:Hsp20 heat shock protein [Synechococcus phage metaG-MbCM1]|uniref:Hsp20 heat shock protein n=1 Tax=Synechococcus phage metaG-MbCM1 TaxID=1079999 RepID=H8ZNE9_9CAUD|nr:Hsp20 heat shock protein [Synechococcus phage metaG-MbCM1]AFD03010.1 Hsp20 heat shock protein [Synechococcus phage metaG-MbCM1]